MFKMKPQGKSNYLIKNIIERTLEKNFTINPISIFILSVFIVLGFLYYYFNAGVLKEADLITLMVFPVLLLLTISLKGRWETIIFIDLAAVIYFYWWNGNTALYYAAIVSVGSLLAPVFQIIKEWERAIILRFGKFHKIKGPGLFIILPFSDSINKIIDLRIRSTDFAAEMTITKDSVPINVDAIAFWMVWDAEKAVLEVENYMHAVILSAQTALRDAIGENDLAVFIAQREELGEELRVAVDKKTTEWGITIQSIEIRDITFPKQLENALTKKAQAIREKESRIILGDAEIELAKKLEEASAIYQNDEVALKLRELNVLLEGLKNGNSMFMVPHSITDSVNSLSLPGIEALGLLNKGKKKATKEVVDEDSSSK
ncbi:MAG: SPFH domain-containing protein [Spirochaetes bacterium]|nr:SPFH domain-containing protein [Spirochaetota bacterium]